MLRESLEAHEGVKFGVSVFRERYSFFRFALSSNDQNWFLAAFPRHLDVVVEIDASFSLQESLHLWKTIQGSRGTADDFSGELRGDDGAAEEDETKKKHYTKN